jgi:hypothetical protein
MSDAWGEPLLTAKSPWYLRFSIVTTLACLGTTVYLGISPLSWGNLLGVAAIVGCAAGIAIAPTLCRVLVFRDGVVAINVWRLWRIPRSEISEIACLDGIKIVLRSRRPVQLSAFPGSVSIILSGNGRGRRFAAQMTDALGLPEQDHEKPGEPTLSPAVAQVRLTSAFVILTAAGLAVVLATVIHAG